MNPGCKLLKPGEEKTWNLLKGDGCGGEMWGGWCALGGGGGWFGKNVCGPESSGLGKAGWRSRL